jgi:type VI secretion system protein ImpL
VFVPPSFTRNGKEQLDALVKELDQAYPVPDGLAAHRERLYGWYRPAFFGGWHAFGSTFPRGADRLLKGGKAWKQVATQMATEAGPHFALFGRMASELEVVAGGGDTPPWVRQLYRILAAKDEAAMQGKEKGSLEKTAEKGKQLLSVVERLFGGESGVTAESRLRAAKAYQEYSGALTAIAQASASRNQLFQLTSQAYSEDPITSKSPFLVAQGASNRLRTEVAGRPADDCSRTSWGQWHSGRIRGTGPLTISRRREERVLAEPGGDRAPEDADAPGGRSREQVLQAGRPIRQPSLKVL